MAAFATTILRIFKTALWLALMAASPSIFAQSLAQAERKLGRQLQTIDSFAETYLGPTHNLDAYDSISHYDSVFGENLQRLTADNPASLHYPFTRLQDLGVTIATSPDTCLRIYSWDGQTGGTARNANNVFQYLLEGKVHSTLNLVDGGPGERYLAIYRLKVGDSTYYLAAFMAVIATLKASAALEVLRLGENGIERNIPLILTPSGATGTLEFGYSLGSIEPEFRFNPANGQITFPVVLPDGEVTKRKITYTFNGKNFVRTSK